MRLYLIATVDRRPGHSFKIMDESNKTLVGVMSINGEKARHEMLLSEADFLKHNKALALLQRRLGFAVFVACIHELDDAKIAAKEKAMKGNTINIITAVAFSNMHFFTLRKLAKERGVEISDCKDNAARAAKINAAKPVPA